ncbi:hypothetical protein F5Y09DRAFT_242552 [Xylaria sp. FL1042]|nr:hypothetical protein F5Y09DRAFT_242552 [Xylaria sp. FL1042]
MPNSPENSNKLFGEGDNDDNAPTHHRPWPYLNAFQQGRFERKFIADGETINFDALPKIQWWMSCFGNIEMFRVLAVLQKVELYSSSAQRPLTATEANAIGEHTVRANRWFAWSQPVTYAIAMSIAFAKRRTFSFPFYVPKMKKFNPNFFPTKKYHFLKDRAATAMWHTLRVAAYASFAWVPSMLFFGLGGMNSFHVHALNDPRLTSLNQGLQRIQQEERQNAQQQHQLRRRPGVPSPAGTVHPQKSQPAGDGASGDGFTPQVYGSTDYSSQPTGAFERSGAVTETSPATQPNWAQSSQLRSDNKDGLFDDDDDDDDASPVAPSLRGQKVDQGQSSSSGSAWDRLRQQARSGNPNWEKGDSSGQERGWAQLRQDKTQDSRDSNPKTDSYFYSSNDEERERRNYGKEQAQKEFDALLEAERRGGDSSASGWRK